MARRIVLNSAERARRAAEEVPKAPKAPKAREESLRGERAAERRAEMHMEVNAMGWGYWN